jgi:hypothetical protein
MEIRKYKLSVAALLGLGALSWACHDSVGTALYVTIGFPPALNMDQLRVSGTVAGSGIGPHVLPEQPGQLLANGETFRVLLPSAPDKAEAELRVEGLHEGTRVALGTGKVQIQEGSEVDITVQLEPAPADFCPNCPEGCCESGLCTTSTFNSCGTGGVACPRCDRLWTDSCSAAGACVCGRGPACDPRATDRCVAGLCRCGFGGPCGSGQECVSGRCVCTPGSCSGCCSSNVCEPGTLRDKCGQGGAACVRCTLACGANGTCT